MLTKFLNMCILVLMLSLPLYGARTHMQRMKPAASTAGEHRADIARLTVLPKDEFLISGHGAPRSEYAECNRDLPAFLHSLAAKGLSPIENVTCIPVEGEIDTYAPAFRAIASEELIQSMATGARYNSLSFCELEAQRMGGELGKTMTVLETACNRVKNSDIGNITEELYVPTVITLAKPAQPGTMKQYSAIEVLVDASGAAARKSLGSSEAAPATN